MNREIKFRAWDTIRTIMIVPEDVDLWHIEAFKDESVIPMQYTGLLDLKYQEIWEGDIIRYGKTGIHIVEWDDTKGRWTWGGFTFSNSALKTLTVIGNIYENPELLSAIE